MFINLTPHPISIVKDDDKKDMVVGTSGFVARRSESIQEAGEHLGIPLVAKKYGKTTDLPDPIPGIYFIVSNLVRIANPDRKDLVSPGSSVSNTSGNRSVKNLIVNL